MFVESFNFDSEYDVFGHPEAIEDQIVISHDVEFPGLWAGGYSWFERRPEAYASFDIYAVVHGQTDRLQGLLFRYATGLEWGHDGYNVPDTELYNPASIGQIIRTMGAPDAIYFDWLSGVEMMLIYNRGIVVNTQVWSPREEMTVKGVTGRYQELCMDGSINFREEFLVAPFDLTDPGTLSVIHNRWIADWIRASDMLPLEDQGWVITQHEIVDAALSPDNTCVYLGPTVCGEGTRCPFAP